MKIARVNYTGNALMRAANGIVTCTSGFFAAVVEAEVQRAGEDQDHRQHLHGRGRTPARKRGRQSCKCRPRASLAIFFSRS